MRISDLVGRWAVVLVVSTLVAGAVGLLVFRDRPMQVTAEFTQVKGVYVGDDVTMLGVPIGKITSIKAQRDRVRVALEIDRDQPIPADAKAAIVGRSLVAVRSIAVAPAYNGGPQLADGATIPLSRTTVPVEWDEMKDQLVRLSQALGPTDTNEKGVANELVHSSAAFLDGRGESLNRTLRSVADALEVLADNRGDVFATVRNLQIFTTALNESDNEVRGFNTHLAAVSKMLNSDRTDLSNALADLQQAFRSVRSFLAANTDLTSSTLRSVDQTISMLAENRTYLANLLQVAPNATSNFYNIEDPRAAAVTGALAPANFGSMAGIVCGALTSLDPEGGDQACRESLDPFLHVLDVDSPPVGLINLAPTNVGPGGGTSTPERENTLRTAKGD